MPRKAMQKDTHHYHYGWIPDHHDPRDHPYSPTYEIPKKDLPRQVDLRPECPAIYDQGHLHSCTAQALAALVHYNMMKEGFRHPFRPSRLFIYYNARRSEHKQNRDTGCKTRNAIKSIARQGDCPESNWPYRITKYNVQPPGRCYRVAVKHKALEYQRLDQNLDQFHNCLATGYPFIAGLKIYRSFEQHHMRRTGRGHVPHRGEKQTGWHAVLAVGYYDHDRRFLLRNSWGKDWGMHGYFTLPYEYLLDSDLSKDFWTVRLVS